MQENDVVVFSGLEIMQGIELRYEFKSEGAGHVVDTFYLIRSSGYVKVGWTGKGFITSRFNQYRTHTPGLQVIGVVKFCGMPKEGAKKTSCDCDLKNHEDLQGDRHVIFESLDTDEVPPQLFPHEYETEWFKIEANLFKRWFELLKFGEDDVRFNQDLEDKSRQTMATILHWEARELVLVDVRAGR